MCFQFVGRRGIPVNYGATPETAQTFDSSRPSWTQPSYCATEVLPVCLVVSFSCRLARRERVGHHSNFLRDGLKVTTAWRLGLITYLLCIAVVGFWPVPVDQPVQGTLRSLLRYLYSYGWPTWISYALLEAAANVAMFVPFGVITAKALPDRPGWSLSFLGLLTSVCMEAGQLFFLSARFPSLLDVAANSLGFVVGLALVRVRVVKTFSACRS
ncbi:VanZ family protein [Paenarthrobacter sp. NPDC057981]|uniref:VanZ family protein n=1 Tax=Paenarthrobacter sp. NPDC057981 TaxID=3346297 RepID=UPI0036DB4670